MKKRFWVFVSFRPSVKFFLSYFDFFWAVIKGFLVFVFSDSQSRVFRAIFVFLKIQQKPEKPHLCNYVVFWVSNPKNYLPKILTWNASTILRKSFREQFRKFIFIDTKKDSVAYSFKMTALSRIITIHYNIWVNFCAYLAFFLCN